MVKLTPDIIEGAGQYINPVRDRELDLRGYKVVFVIDKHFYVRCQDQDVEVNTLLEACSKHCVNFCGIWLTPLLLDSRDREPWSGPGPVRLHRLQ